MKIGTGKPSVRRNAIWLIPGAIAAYALTRFFLEKRFRAEISLLVEILDLKPGQVVADIGAGKGRMTVAIASIVGSAGRVFSTEIDAKRSASIGRVAQEARLENVTVLTSGVSDSGLPENCCDAIYLRNVYHHITQPSEFDRSLWRALRPGGYIAIIDFSPKFFLLPWRPKGVPENRGGHGIPVRILIDELTGADFQVVRSAHDWPGGNYCVLFRKPA